LVGAAEIGPSLRVSMYQAALLAAPAPDDRKPVLAGLAAIRTVEALNAVAPSLDEEALRAEAVQAIVKITCPADGENKGLRGPEVAAVLKRAAQAATDEALRKQIEDHLASMQ
ncbi:MAG: hypothetical protein QG656_2157, partial [Candidatus Hydrogenedentes bacterium]|nr:hypothetical protein [Candidatus Hydrogenedentota bacterium]